MAPPACCYTTAAFDPNLDSAPFADPAILKKTDFPGTNTGRVPNSGVRSYFGFFYKLLAPPECCGKIAAFDLIGFCPFLQHYWRHLRATNKNMFGGENSTFKYFREHPYILPKK